jgi:hypothetical protein
MTRVSGCWSWTWKEKRKRLLKGYHNVLTKNVTYIELEAYKKATTYRSGLIRLCFYAFISLSSTPVGIQIKGFSPKSRSTSY